jgi:hypothetical protein
MGEDFREGRIQTTTELAENMFTVHGRLADITELKAPVDARSGN